MVMKLDVPWWVPYLLTTYVREDGMVAVKWVDETPPLLTKMRGRKKPWRVPFGLPAGGNPIFSRGAQIYLRGRSFASADMLAALQIWEKNNHRGATRSAEPDDAWFANAIGSQAIWGKASDGEWLDWVRGVPRTRPLPPKRDIDAACDFIAARWRMSQNGLDILWNQNRGFVTDPDTGKRRPAYPEGSVVAGTELAGGRGRILGAGSAYYHADDVRHVLVYGRFPVGDQMISDRGWDGL